MTYFTAKTFELHNGGASYSYAENGDTLRFEVRSGDRWKYDTSYKERSEISSYKLFDYGKTYQISYSFMIENGDRNTADWLLIGQIHQTEDAADLPTSPPFAIELVGERMRIVARTTTEATTTVQPPMQVLWMDSADIKRGQWYDMKIEVKFDPYGNGVINVVRDGVIIVQYSGPTGFVDLKGSYWKEGIYRESSPETMAVDFKGLTVAESTGTSILQGAVTLAKPALESSANVVTAVTTTVLPTGGIDLTLSGTAAINGTGNELANIIKGNDAANTLNGNGGDDTLYGFGGNDVLNGGAGADKMYGGLGDDTYNVNDAGDQTIELAGEGTDTVNASLSWTLSANIENLNLTGSAAINGTGNELANVITGNEAANVISGGAGDDLLRGNGGNDTLWGGDGNDTLNGGTGADLMYGGRGDDVYNVDNVGDQVIEYAGEGVDLVNSTVSFTLGANVENLVLLGTSAINGTGNALANAITGNEAANVLYGMDGNDVLRGNGGNDVLWGGAGNDTLSGGTGNDTLHGGTGADIMSGGTGADIFVFDTLADIDYNDVIQDFVSSQGDKVDLRAIDANVNVAGDQAFTYLGAGAFTGVAGQLHMVRESSNVWHVEGDINGDRVADFSFTMNVGSALLASDFFL